MHEYCMVLDISMFSIEGKRVSKEQIQTSSSKVCWRDPINIQPDSEVTIEGYRQSVALYSDYCTY